MPPLVDNYIYFDFPVTKTEKTYAKAMWMMAKGLETRQPRFIKPDGTVWMIDQGGQSKARGGKKAYYFTQVARKNAENAKRRFRKFGLTPTFDDWEAAWPGRGRDLCRAERLAVQNIYLSTRKDEEVDHANPLCNKGLHYSSNLFVMSTEMNGWKSTQTPEELGPEFCSFINYNPDPIGQLQMHGPKGTDEQMVRILEKARERALEASLAAFNVH